MCEFVFNRIEEKYLLTKKQYEDLLEMIKMNVKEDAYFKSTICNIYFDTISNDLIIHSNDKPVFKEKIRLRSYKVPSKEDDVFLEIKEKYNEVVGKRRIRLKLEDFYLYQKGLLTPDSQIFKELDYYFNHFKLIPAYFICYDRLSYVGIDNSHLRLTFDSNLRSRTKDLNLESGDYGEVYFKDDEVIMEIKTVGSMPLWLVRSLSKLKIYPTSFSKYGKIFEKDNLLKESVVYA